MELPNAKYRERYIELVRGLEEDLKVAAESGEASDLVLHTMQQRLDAIASKYQNDEKIGTARYKLYELQAFVYYFDHQDDKALDFIKHAIDLKGSTYQKAEKLRRTLESKLENAEPERVDESRMTKEDKRKNLVGLEGWLALFIVGQFLTLLITAFRFFADGFTSSSDVSALNEYQSGLGDTLQTLTAFENVAILIYAALVITTLTLIFRRRKLAKPFAITALVFAAVYGMSDYAVASSIFDSSGLSQMAELQSFMSKYSGDVGRSVTAALIWVPYFLISRRVKATLTRA